MVRKLETHRFGWRMAAPLLKGFDIGVGEADRLGARYQGGAEPAAFRRALGGLQNRSMYLIGQVANGNGSRDSTSGSLQAMPAHYATAYRLTRLRARRRPAAVAG